jgi:ABC-type glycerol-3-phosphate transport system permease component
VHPQGVGRVAFVLGLVTKTGMRALPDQLYMLKDAMGVQDYAVYNAFAVLSVLALLITHPLLERRVVESIVSGAVQWRRRQAPDVSPLDLTRTVD